MSNEVKIRIQEAAYGGSQFFDTLSLILSF